MIMENSEFYKINSNLRSTRGLCEATYSKRGLSVPLLKDGIGVQRPNLGTWDLNRILRRRDHLRASPRSTSFVFPLHRFGHSYCTRGLNWYASLTSRQREYRLTFHLTVKIHRLFALRIKQSYLLSYTVHTCINLYKRLIKL